MSTLAKNVSQVVLYENQVSDFVALLWMQTPLGSRTRGGTYHLHVTVYCLVHLQYWNSSPEEASRYVGENLTRMFLLCLC